MSMNKNGIDAAFSNVLAKNPKISRMMDDMAKLDNISLTNINSFGSKEDVKLLWSQMLKFNKMLNEKITFVNGDLSEAIPFTRENLYLLCAYTGSGKSTMAANISYPLWKEKKKVLVISNEEPGQDVLFRIACLDLGYNFNDYKKGLMPFTLQVEAMKRFNDIVQYVKVIDVTHNEGVTCSTVEGIKKTLDQVRDEDYSCVLIDYYQQIQRSIEDPSRSRYDVLNDLRIWMGQYIRSSNIPIVLFAQLHSMGKRNNKDLDSRIKECPTIIEPSTVVIEVVPNFKDKTTNFIIKKDRFGSTDQTVTCGFQNGRYVNMTDAFRKAVAENQLKNLQDKLDKDADVVPPVEDVKVTAP